MGRRLGVEGGFFGGFSDQFNGAVTFSGFPRH